MPQLFSAIKKTYLQVKPYNSEKLAYKLIFIKLSALLLNMTNWNMLNH